MFSIGAQELLLIAVVLVILVKPADIPRLVRQMGYWYGRCQRWLYILRNEIEAMDDFTGGKK